MTVQEKKSRLLREQIGSYLTILLGALIYSIGQLFFIKPLHIPMGGVAGVSLVLNYLWNLPIGAVSIVLNLPLFFLGWRTMGRDFFYKTVFATVASSVFLDLLAGWIPAFQGEMLIAALYGGIVMGAGFGIIFRAGGTSGGTDIIAKWLNKKKDLPIGTVNFAINIVIICASALIYGNPDSALYAIMTSFLSSQVIDKLVYGMDVQKNAMIITDRPQEVAQAIMERLNHGVTALDGTGMYTGDRRTVLICAVRRHESGTLKKILLEQDEHAFMLLSNINEVFGKGFKHLQQ